LAKTAGMIGIHFYTSYLGPTPTPEDVYKQVDYVANIVGIDHVGLGIDFFPTYGAWKKLQVDQGAKDLRWAVEDMSQMPRITECLLDHGMSEADVQKVLGGNALRVFEAVFRG
jgi:membrane dipeptidase